VSYSATSRPTHLQRPLRPLRLQAKGYPIWTRKGDTNAFFTLFFDSLVTQLGMMSNAYIVGFTPDFVYKHFMGGLTVSLFVGNVYYALQASKVAMETGKMDTCAQPYGVNTPGAIAKTFGVLAPALALASAEGLDTEAAMTKAWSVACAANFVGGLVEFAGAFLAVLVFKLVPYGAMLVPIGGVGMTWLGYAYFIQVVAPPDIDFPIVPIIPFFILWVSFFGNTSTLTGPVPSVLAACIMGIVLYVCVDAGRYKDHFGPAAELVGEASFSLPDLSEGFKELSKYGSLVASLAFTSFIGTYACNIQARVGGDIFSPMESMMVDGLGTMIGALCGSPWGTTVYIGHTTYKKFGATRGYSALCGIFFLVFGLSGLYGILDSLIPHDIYVGILACIGMLIAGQCVEVTPKRWYPAIMMGLAICWSDMIQVWGADNRPFTDGVNDILVLSPSYLWTSMLWTFLLMMLIDRWWASATVILLVMTFLTSVGLIHSGEISVDYTAGHHDGARTLSPATWKIIVSYAAGAGVTAIYAALQRKGIGPPAEEEDFRIVQQEKYGTNKKDPPKDAEAEEA